LRVYISFAQEDRPQVRELESRLRAEGFETWFDEKDLTAGLDWKEQIRQALPRSDVFVSCISTRSVSRKGFYDEEIALALTLRSARPDFVIPIRLDECEVPEAYRAAHLRWVDVFDDAGVALLIRDLKRRTVPRARSAARIEVHSHSASERPAFQKRRRPRAVAEHSR
jgi:TIR domain-containing protein